LIVGATNDLSQARAQCGKAAAGEGLDIFTRLNVARSVRMAEHEDLAGRHSAARVIEGVT
jgi:hypothetical protein